MFNICYRSGKTHSIVGNLSEEEDQGIVPRALRHIFSTIEEQSRNISRSLNNKNKFTVNDSTGGNSNSNSINMMTSIRLSFLEIYNDECRDLLHQEIHVRGVTCFCLFYAYVYVYDCVCVRIT